MHTYRKRGGNEALLWCICAHVYICSKTQYETFHVLTLACLLENFYNSYFNIFSPGNTHVCYFMLIVIVDEGQAQVLYRDVDFLLELLQLFSLASFSHYSHIISKKKDALTAV